MSQAEDRLTREALQDLMIKQDILRKPQKPWAAAEALQTAMQSPARRIQTSEQENLSTFPINNIHCFFAQALQKWADTSPSKSTGAECLVSCSR